MSCYSEGSCSHSAHAFLKALRLLKVLILLSLLIVLFELFNMSEQDVYSSHLGISQEKVEAATKAYDLRHSTGSEQERYAAHFTWKRPDKSVDTIWGSESPRRVAPVIVSEAEEETINARFSLPQRRVIDASAVGILKSTLLPSLAMQSGLSIIAYSGSRLTNRVDGKDWLWPAGQVINAWTSAVGAKILCHHEDVWNALSDLSYAHKLILTGVTLWGGRLFYRVVSRSISRGHDEPRYEAAKAEPDFWNQSLFTIFLPEAVFQTVISLPFTLSVGGTQQAYSPYPIPAFAELATGLGVFMFGAGFALEVLADAQLAEHYEKSKDLDTSGVWSIVRHPK